MLNNKNILITGGTGSLGNELVKSIFQSYDPKKVIIYSRDEYKQWLMADKFSSHADKMRFFLGDVRDIDRLHRSLESVDYVVHAAALKQVPALEYNPTEAVRTNVTGSENVVNAAVNAGVKKAIFVSTDKAVNPINLYGATKLVAEKIFISGNSYFGGKTTFAAVRYGNVIGSRGSVIPTFLALRQRGEKKFPITNMNMTRFWITLEESVQLVFNALKESIGGEIFVPQIPSMRIIDLARAIDSNCVFVEVGVRPGEKIHEVLVNCDEARNTKIFEEMYVILPQFIVGEFSEKLLMKYGECPSLADDFSFASNSNDRWLKTEKLKELLA